MNQISDPPNDNTAGLDFDYNAWAPNTRITMTNIPLRPDYMFVMSPARAREFNKFIDEQPNNFTYTNSKYAPIDRPIEIDLTFNEASRFNYVRVYNPAQPNGLGSDRPNYFYYFIQDVVYSATNNTKLIVQLDVWATYINRVRIGRGFVERGHMGIANESQMSNNGRDYLTVPEGLDVGTDHVPVGISIPAVMQNNNHGVLVTATQDLEKDAGTVAKPIINAASAQIGGGMLSGASRYLFPDASSFISFVIRNKSRAHLLESITSVMFIPSPTRYWTQGELGAILSIGAYRMPQTAPRDIRTVGLADWRNNIARSISSRYRNLKKMFTYPYMYVYASNRAGQNVVMRPELIAGNDIAFWEEAGFAEQGARIQWYLDAYNGGQGYDYAVTIGNLPQTSVTIDGGMLAMSRGSQSIAFASAQADWNLAKGMRANALGSEQATQGMNMSTDLMNTDLRSQRTALGIDKQLSTQQAMTSTITNVGGGAIAGGAMGGVVGGALGAVGGGVASVISNIGTINQQNANQEKYNNSARSQRGANAVTGAYGAQIRDSNRALADWATKGDYHMEIAARNAAISDIMASPPSTVGQANGEAMSFIKFRLGLQLQVRIMDEAHMNLVGEYWLRYGYAINRYMQIPNELQVMSHFTYWKITDLAVQGNIPDRFVATLRGILEKGVTVVEDPFDMGFIDPALNKPKAGYKIGDDYTPPIVIDPPVEPPTEITRRKRNRMICYSTVSTDPAAPGNTWALAGSSPGTDANFIITTDPTRGAAFIDATGQKTPVGLTEPEFLDMRNQYRSPLAILNGDPV